MSSSSDRARSPGPRRKFTNQEDVKLRSLVEQLGAKSWEEIAKFMPSRSARQCRDRYKNYLLDSLVASPWTPNEDAIIVERYRELGPKWVEIAKGLNGRSGNHVKNRWHRHLWRQDDTCAAPISPEPSETESEEEPKEEGAPLLLCPVLQFGRCDWAQLFDRMESSLGYESAWRTQK
jgi:hypothetical protein